MGKRNQDYIDASRWRAMKAMHSVKLCRLATGSVSYDSRNVGAILDAWADMAVVENVGHDQDLYLRQVDAELEAMRHGR